jgi:myo-inositol-1(or 4)-monophosphatase
MKDEYLKFAKDLAYQAGGIMLKYFQLGVEYRMKEDETAVTKADEEINQLVIDKVAEKYPDQSIFGEEGSVDKKSKLIWVCDPIDGTHPFMKGLPVSVFSLALVDNGVPILGVVYDPYNKRLYSAVKGHGAFLNDKPIKISNLDLVSEATVNIEWWSEAELDIDTPLHRLSLDTKAYVLHLGCVVNAACLVAAGQYEACLYAGTKGKNVDIAAIKVIVEEAGGKVTDINGVEQRYDVRDINGAIISNGIVHSKVLEYMKNI